MIFVTQNIELENFILVNSFDLIYFPIKEVSFHLEDTIIRYD